MLDVGHYTIQYIVQYGQISKRKRHFLMEGNGGGYVAQRDAT